MELSACLYCYSGWQVKEIRSVLGLWYKNESQPTHLHECMTDLRCDWFVQHDFPLVDPNQICPWVTCYLLSVVQHLCERIHSEASVRVIIFTVAFTISRLYLFFLYDIIIKCCINIFCTAGHWLISVLVFIESVSHRRVTHYY